MRINKSENPINMREKDLNVINMILKNRISKNEIKKMTRIKDWYYSRHYSEDIYLPYVNYFENEIKPELGSFIFNYLLSTNNLRQLRSLIEIDLNFQKYINESEYSFLQILIKFVNYDEHWIETFKKVIDIEGDKNRLLLINNINLLCKQYKPLDIIIESLFKKKDVEYWLGADSDQNKLIHEIILFLKKDTNSFKSNKSNKFDNISRLSESFLLVKNKLSPSLSSFLMFFCLYENEKSYEDLKEIAKNLDKDVIETLYNLIQFDEKVSDVKKNYLKNTFLQLKSIQEKEEISCLIERNTEPKKMHKRI